MQTRWGKRLMAALCALSMLLSGCRPMMDDASETKYISATFYPIYALAINITKDVPALELNCLTQPQDGCIRSYQLSDWDYAMLMNQDVLILGGKGLESFEGVLAQQTTGPILLSTLEGAHLREETAGDADDENTAHFLGENPWVFLSAAGAMEISIAVAGGMAEIDEPFAALYEDNLKSYLARLERLAGEMSDLIAQVPHRPVAALHEGVTYFAAQFSLPIACVYPREPGSDVTENDLEALLKTLHESGAEVILLEEQAPDSLVSALENAGYPVARIDTMTAHMANGDMEAYEKIMLQNAQAARDALRRAP